MELDERWDCRVRVPRRSKKRLEASRYPYRFKRVYEGPERFYFEARGLTRAQRDDILAKAREDKFVFSSAERSFRRSLDYRDRFLEANPGPWRCRYCNRPIADSGEMTVDHIVPVDAVDPFGSYSGARRAMARRALGRLGMRGVNDLANLAPCCRRCNSSKGNRMGLWTVRGLLGAKRWYWPALRALRAAAVVFALACIAWAATALV